MAAARRFVYVSSTSVYGQTDGEEVDETAATEPQEESGKIVLEAERCWSASAQRRHPALRRHLRPGPAAPPPQPSSPGEPIVADPDKWLNLIHVEDGAAAVLAAAERGRAGRFTTSRDGVPVPPSRFLLAPGPAAQRSGAAVCAAGRRVSLRRTSGPTGGSSTARCGRSWESSSSYPTYEEGWWLRLTLSHRASASFLGARQAIPERIRAAIITACCNASTSFPNVIEMNYQAGRRLGVNVYLIDGGSEFLLIDIGYLDTVDEIVELIRQMDFNLSTCKMIIATHADADHIQGIGPRQGAAQDQGGRPSAHASSRWKRGDEIMTYATIKAQDIDIPMPPLQDRRAAQRRRRRSRSAT